MTDKNLINRVDEGSKDAGAFIWNAGTYYIAFMLKDEAIKEYKVYTPTVVRFMFKGTAIRKGKTKIVKNPLPYGDAGEPVPVSINIDPDKTKGDAFYITYSTRNGETGTAVIGYNRDYERDYYIDKKTNTVTLDNIDNGARGRYTITIEGMGNYTGKFKLTYNVK